MRTFKNAFAKNLEKIAIIFGYVMESFFLPSFAFFMFPLIPVFFYTQDPEITSYIIYLLFGVGYIARPVGAILFGTIADRYGARLSLVLSLSLAVMATIFIGFLPIKGSYIIFSQIGLFVLRFLQGVGCGNNTASLSVYYHDNYGYKHGFITGLTFSLGLIGFILAKILSITEKLDYSSGWRTPFLVSGILGILAVLLRYLYIPKLFDKNKTSKIQFLKFLTNHKKPFFFSVLTAGLFVMPLYICVFLLNRFAELFTIGNYKLINIVVILVSKIFFFLFIGYNFEKINFRKCNTFILLAHVLIPFSFIEKSTLYSPVLVYFIQILFLCANVFFVFYYFRYIPSLFPEEIRYRAVGLSFATGYATLGGFCLVFFEYLDNISNVYNFSAIFMAGVALLLFLMDMKQKSSGN